MIRLQHCRALTRIEKVDAGKLHHDMYRKVVLSSDPPSGGECTVVLVHRGSRHSSFAKAGGERWVKAASRSMPDGDFVYKDCVHHRGRFYSSAVEAWDLGAARAVVGVGRPARRPPELSDKRYLVLAPWGHLLLVQKVCSYYRARGPDDEAFRRNRRDVIKVDKVDVEGTRLVETASLRGHALLL